MKRLEKRLVKFDTMDRQKGSGHARMTATRGIEKAVNNLFFSQKDQLEIHMHPRETFCF